MPEKKRKQQSFEYGAIILLCSTVLVKVIGAIFKIPLQSLIGTVGFGYFTSAYDLFASIYALAMAGLPIAISRVVAQNMAEKQYGGVRQSLKVTRKLFFFTGMLGFVLMLILIYPFVKLTDPTGKTVYSLFAIAPAILFCCVMSTYRGYYEGLRNMYPTAVSDIIEALGKLVLGYGFAYIVMKINGNVAYAAAAAIFGITVGAAISALYMRLRFLIKGDGITKEELAASPLIKTNRTAAKELILIAIPVVLASLANNVASLVDVSMVKWQLTGLTESNAELLREMYASSIADYNLSAKELLSNAEIPTFLYGVRGMAFTIYNLIPTITSVLGVSALPVLASSWTMRDKPLIKRNIESTIKLTAIITMPAGLGFVALGSNIMGVLYNGVAAYDIGGSMLRIYGVAAIFAGLAIPMTSMLQAIGKQVISLRNVAIGAALKVIVNFVLVGMPDINIKGAAVGTAVCYIFIFVANLISIIKYTKVVPNFVKVLLKPFAAATVCALCAYLVPVEKIVSGNTMITFGKIAVAAAVYLIVLILLNTFEADDITALPKGEKLLKIAKKFKIVR